MGRSSVYVISLCKVKNGAQRLSTRLIIPQCAQTHCSMTKMDAHLQIEYS